MEDSLNKYNIFFNAMFGEQKETNTFYCLPTHTQLFPKTNQGCTICRFMRPILYTY